MVLKVKSQNFYCKSDTQCQKMQNKVVSWQHKMTEGIKMISKVTSTKYLLRSKDQELTFRKIYTNNHNIIYYKSMYE